MFDVPLKRLNLNYYYHVLYVSPHRINGGVADTGCSSMAPTLPLPRLYLFPSLICTPTKQPYSKVDNFRMYRSKNVVSTSSFC